ncbi:hypothetical protein FO470_13395 [Starkeya sp. 3C]|uniref:Uncharacterized protein n=1 Tax=Ancylobacter moscoviensis TaxID=2597768 RepID=A0ABY3DQ27_9HYPH|nr:hypothetical protein [Ancylobacter moscoviensis]TSJ61476.1 hypothetical protein FO470_13395 [Ancylobacter moscoviensis]
MADRSFLPGARAANVIIALGGLALGWAIYMRYALVEQSAVGLACRGVETATCETRALVITLFGYSVFGIAALIASLIQLVRPSLVMFTIALMAMSIGVVMYNNNLAALAGGLLLISFARPWRGARG